MKSAIRLHERTVPSAGATDDGSPPAAPSAVHALPNGTRLLGYQLRGVIGEGGFGIVYLADNPAAGAPVAIKEYLPALWATRAALSQQVVPKSPRHAEGFRAGLQSFVDEAEMLGCFDHPALVKVIHCWQANGTAYLVMPYHEGPTLAAALEALGGAPDEAQLRGWLAPLLDALETLHAAHCLHRDIAPDNILLTRAGPVLLDFGAARRVAGDPAAAPTVLIKRGYAPIEQYGHAPSMTQGPWTDLYALAGVVYAAITGRPPMAAVERLMDDRFEPLSHAAAGRYGAPFLAAIDRALALMPSRRPQSVEAFRALLDGVTEQTAAPEAPPAAAAASHHGRVPWRAPVALAGALALAAAVMRFGGDDDPARQPPTPAPPPPTAAAADPAPAPAPAAETPAAPAPTPAAQAVAAPAPSPAALPPAPARPAASGAPDAGRVTARAAVAPPPAARAELHRQCTEILQQASIEPLRAAQAAFLKRECQ